MENAVIVGTGGHAQMLYAVLEQVQQPVSLVGWLEHSAYQGPESCCGLPVWVEQAANPPALDAFYVGMGMVSANPGRWQIVERLCAQGLRPLTLIHPTAVVDPTATIEPGCYIGAQAVIQPYARIGAASIVNTGAVVEHHVTVGQNSHIAPRAVICGQATLGDHVFVGAASVVLQGLSVGDAATIGAGSVVTRSVGAGLTIAGNPARELVRP